MTQRTIQIADQAPQAQIEIVDEQNYSVGNVLGGVMNTSKSPLQTMTTQSMMYTETFNTLAWPDCILHTY